MELTPPTDLNEVERLVECLKDGLAKADLFNASDGVSAVLTFAYRFAASVVSLSGNPESKQLNAAKISEAMRRLAGLLEFDAANEIGGKVH